MTRISFPWNTAILGFPGEQRVGSLIRDRKRNKLIAICEPPCSENR